MTSLIFWPEVKRLSVSINTAKAEGVITSRQACNLVVLRNVTIQTYVLEMLADDMRRGITLTGALTRGFQIIELLDKLAKALLKELFPRNPCVELVIQA